MNGSLVARGLRGLSRRLSSAASDESPLKRLLAGAAAYGEGGPAEGDLHWATQPYSSRPEPPRPEPRDPRDAAILLFPGQGAQFVGMGKRLMHLPQVKDLYALASETLKWDVARVCLEGPEDELLKHAQVCILVTSLGALELARESRAAHVERVAGAAGFSLGEVTALVAAGAIQLEPALRLVQLRAAAMQAASEQSPGGLLTVYLSADHRLSAALSDARAHALERGVEEPVCEVANYLYPNCKVVAGDEESLSFISRSGANYGVRRAIRVPVSGPFHSRAMLPAVEPLRAALKLMKLSDPSVPVWSNVDAKPYRTAKDVYRKLPRQLHSPVRWEQSLHALYARRPGQRFPLTLALGPGQVGRATLRQVNAKAWDSCVQVDV